MTTIPVSVSEGDRTFSRTVSDDDPATAVAVMEQLWSQNEDEDGGNDDGGPGGEEAGTQNLGEPPAGQASGERVFSPDVNLDDLGPLRLVD